MMDLDLSSNSVVVIKLEEKSKKPSVNLKELNQMPREDEDVRVSIWLMKNRPFFPKLGFSDADADSNSSNDNDMSGSDFRPVPPPSPSNSILIDVVGSSSKFSGTAKYNPCNQTCGVISAPGKTIDQICYRSGVAMKRSNTHEQSHQNVASKCPRYDNMTSQHQQQCKGKMWQYRRPCDLLELECPGPGSDMQDGNGMTHSSSNLKDSMIVMKSNYSMNMSQSSEHTHGIIGRFFRWLFPDA